MLSWNNDLTGVNNTIATSTIDAMLASVSFLFEKTPVLTEEQVKYLNYTITYENDEVITTKQLVKKEEFVRLFEEFIKKR